MPKTNLETPEKPVEAAAEKPEVRNLAVIFSAGMSLYQVPAYRDAKKCWLSVQRFNLPISQVPANGPYLGAAITADGKYWRKAYQAGGAMVVLYGHEETRPADDALVADYAAAEPGKARD